MSSEASESNGHVSGSFANILFDWVEVNNPELVSSVPFDRPDFGELSRVQVSQWREMLDWVNERAARPDFPISLAESVKPANMGLLGYIAACSANLGEAFARLQQFENLVYSINHLQVSLLANEVCLRWGAENGKPGHLVDSVAVCVLMAFTRQLTGMPIRPLSVSFINERPDHPQAFEQFFGCPVSWRALNTELVFAPEVLATPMRTPDSILRRILDEQAEKLLRQVRQEKPEVVAGISKAIQESVAAGIPTLQEVAKRLHVSTRTLQRKLQDKGVNFRELLQDIRMQMAETCLARGELALADIAALLGYNDQAAFTHAFKRAKGITPASYRKNSKG